MFILPRHSFDTLISVRGGCAIVLFGLYLFCGFGHYCLKAATFAVASIARLFAASSRHYRIMCISGRASHHILTRFSQVLPHVNCTYRDLRSLPPILALSVRPVCLCVRPSSPAAKNPDLRQVHMASMIWGLVESSQVHPTCYA